MLNVNKVKLLSERTSRVPPIIFRSNSIEVLTSAAKFTLEIMVPEFCSDDNSILKGTLRSNAS